MSLALAPGLNTVRVYVKAPGGASDRYEVRLYVRAGLALSVWHPSEALTELPDDPAQAYVTAHPNGHALMMWRRRVQSDWGLLTRSFTSDGGWAAAEELYRGTVYPPVGDIAVGAAGDAVHVWPLRQSTSSVGSPSDAWARVYAPGVGWSDAALIESEAVSVSLPRVFVDAQGVALAVWRASDERCYFNRHVPGTGWGNTASPLPLGQANGCARPVLAGHDDGSAFLVWGDSFVIWSQRYEPPAGWGTPEALSNPGADAYSASLAVGADGSAVAAWHQTEPGPDGETISSVWASYYHSMGEWGGWEPPAVVEPYDLDTSGEMDAPAVAVGADGTAFVAWTQWEVHDEYSFFRGAGVRANLYRPGTGWGDARVVAVGNGFDRSSEPPSVQELQVVADAFGNAVAVWARHGPVAPDVPGDRIWSSTYRPVVGWSEPLVVSEPGDLEKDWQSEPALIPTGAGAAQAIWTERRASTYAVRASRFE